MPSAQFLDNASRSPSYHHPPPPLHPPLLLSTIPSRAFAALFYFYPYHVSNDTLYSSVLCHQGPATHVA